jgi:hypothetical protein
MSDYRYRPKDCRCPYCDEYQEINHDDGYGYDPDLSYEQMCWNCDEVFEYTVFVRYTYTTRKKT